MILSRVEGCRFYAICRYRIVRCWGGWWRRRQSPTLHASSAFDAITNCDFPNRIGPISNTHIMIACIASHVVATKYHGVSSAIHWTCQSRSIKHVCASRHNGARWSIRGKDKPLLFDRIVNSEFNRGKARNRFEGLSVRVVACSGPKIDRGTRERAEVDGRSFPLCHDGYQWNASASASLQSLQSRRAEKGEKARYQPCACQKFPVAGRLSYTDVLCYTSCH